MKNLWITFAVFSIFLFGTTKACRVSYPKISNYCSGDCSKYQDAEKRLQNFTSYFDSKYFNDFDKYRKLQSELLQQLTKIEDSLEEQGKLDGVLNYKIQYLKKFFKHDPNSKC